MPTPETHQPALRRALGPWTFLAFGIMLVRADQSSITDNVVQRVALDDAESQLRAGIYTIWLRASSPIHRLAAAIGSLRVTR